MEEGGGGSSSAPPANPAPTVQVSVAPQSITQGQSATLTWTTTHGTTATLSEGVESSVSLSGQDRHIDVIRQERGITLHIREPRISQQEPAPIDLTGSKTVNPAVTTTYTIVVNGPGGTAQGQATLQVHAAAPTDPITANITISPLSISPGQQAAVTWQTANATSATINGQAISLNGSMTVSPSVTTTYTLVATGPGGTVQSEATLQVVASPPPQQVTATLSVAPQSISTGQSATVSWQTTNATTATINNQAVALFGSMAVSPTTTTTYTLVATGPGGSAQAQAILQVSTSLPMSPDDLVKTYNINAVGAESHGKTMRWVNGNVTVYDSTGFAQLKQAVDAWNAAIGGPVTLVISNNTSSDIRISFDSSISAGGDCGLASPGVNTGTGGDNSIWIDIIKINPSCGSNLTVYMHEIGHAIGFFGHTHDGGVMDQGGSSQITTEDAAMIHHLYELPVGTLIP